MIKIGNAQAFWGDDIGAAHDLATLVPSLDYLTLDYLAEVTLSIMAIQKRKDPNLGYAKDFISVVESLIPLWNAGAHFQVITNAGGLNPMGLASACSKLLTDLKGSPIRIAVVEGDHVLETIQTNPKDPQFQNLENGQSIEAIAPKLSTANAYLGSRPIVEALESNPHLIITGRIADPSLTVAPCIHRFGWSFDDYDSIAGATLAGHLIECGRQVTGGISSGWERMQEPAWIGFPIVEVSKDGTFTVTKPSGSGGKVTEMTVKEQMLYEIGDPKRYLSPDVTLSLEEVSVHDVGEDRVRVQGAIGKKPLDTLKVSATFEDGFRCDGMLAIYGENAPKRAKLCGETILKHLEAAIKAPKRSLIECIGAGDLVPGIHSPSENIKECMLHIAVADDDRSVCERFSKEIAPMVTAGPPGTTGYTTGRPPVREVLGYWPCLIDSNKVEPKVHIIEVKP